MRTQLFAVLVSALLVGCQTQVRSSASPVPAPTRGVFGSTPSLMPKLSFDLVSGLIAVDSGAPVYFTVLAVDPKTGEMSVVFPLPGGESLLTTELAFQVELRDEPPDATSRPSELDAINRGRCANPVPMASGGIPACVPGRDIRRKPSAPSRALLALATSRPIVVATDSAQPAKGRGLQRFLPEQWAGAWLWPGSTARYRD